MKIAVKQKQFISVGDQFINPTHIVRVVAERHPDEEPRVTLYLSYCESLDFEGEECAALLSYLYQESKDVMMESEAAQ